MGEGKKVALSLLLILVLFVSAGKLLFDKKVARADQMDGFFESLNKEGSLNYFSKIKGVLKTHNCMEIEVAGSHDIELFYLIDDGKTKKTERCTPDIKLKFNDHSVSGLIYGSYNINGAVLSEVVTGNLQINGLMPFDFLRMV